MRPGEAMSCNVHVKNVPEERGIRHREYLTNTRARVFHTDDLLKVIRMSFCYEYEYDLPESLGKRAIEKDRRR